MCFCSWCSCATVWDSWSGGCYSWSWLDFIFSSFFCGCYNIFFIISSYHKCIPYLFSSFYICLVNHSSNQVSVISSWTMHQYTTPSLSQTIWPRWVSIQFLTLPIVQTLFSVTFGYFLSSEAVVMRQLRRWKRLWWRWLTRTHKRTSMGPSRSFWNGTTSALQPEEITLKGTWVSCVYYE